MGSAALPREGELPGALVAFAVKANPDPALLRRLALLRRELRANVLGTPLRQREIVRRRARGTAEDGVGEGRALDRQVCQFAVAAAGGVVWARLPGAVGAQLKLATRHGARFAVLRHSG